MISEKEARLYIYKMKKLSYHLILSKKKRVRFHVLKTVKMELLEDGRTLIFFSVNFSQRRILQIWWDLSLRQGAQDAQLSLRMQPTHSPQRFRFFFDCFSPSMLESLPLDVMCPIGCLKPRAVDEMLGTWASEASLLELSIDDARYFRFSFFRPSGRAGREPCEEKGDRESSVSSLMIPGDGPDWIGGRCC